MEEKELGEFSWTGLFVVTSLCFFAFSAILEFLDHDHPRIFIWIGSISLLFAMLNAASTFMRRAVSKSKQKLHS